HPTPCGIPRLDVGGRGLGAPDLVWVAVILDPAARLAARFRSRSGRRLARSLVLRKRFAPSPPPDKLARSRRAWQRKLSPLGPGGLPQALATRDAVGGIELLRGNRGLDTSVRARRHLPCIP